MALPQAAGDPVNKDAHAKLESDANRRKREARRWKELWVLDFKECYFFCAPHRQRQISSQTKPPVQRLLDAPELYTSLAFELCQDFVTEVVNTYMPEAQRWCERGPGMMINQEMWDQAKEQVKSDDTRIFEAMKASNLYSEIQKSFYPDLAIGTCAMWIDKPHANSAINCSAITLRELEVNLGPFGEIDDRFAVRFTRNRYVRAILLQSGISELPKELSDDIEKNPEVQTEITFCFWRLWDRHDDEVWQHAVLVKDKLVHDAILMGEGSCPLIVPRFNPSADWPWGLGPMLQGLYDLRQVDELQRQKSENVELHLTPPFTFPDDSWTAIEQGVEPGFGYPIRPGSEGAVKRIYDPPPPDVAIYYTEEMEKRLRRLFFVDFPQQSGDTPPTLGQWLDEMARAQRRIGTPGMSFWKEGPAKIFLRFKHLLEKSGTIMPITVDGKIVSLQAYNPAQRAAEQQEIATATQYAQIMAQMFPEEWRMSIDGHDTMQKFAEKMRVTAMFGFRSDAAKKAFLQQVAPLIGARHEPGGNTGTGCWTAGRAMNEQQPISPHEEETRAIDLIARTPEGRLLHRYLRRVLETCFDFTEASTLQASNGRRTLARDLMGLMAQGITDTTRTDARSATANDDALLKPAGRAANVARSARRRRVAREPDDGWGPIGSDDAGATGGNVTPIR